MQNNSWVFVGFAATQLPYLMPLHSIWQQRFADCAKRLNLHVERSIASSRETLRGSLQAPQRPEAMAALQV